MQNEGRMSPCNHANFDCLGECPAQAHFVIWCPDCGASNTESYDGELGQWRYPRRKCEHSLAVIIVRSSSDEFDYAEWCGECGAHRVVSHDNSLGCWILPGDPGADLLLAEF
jgi:hypothetical protein